MFIHQTDKFTVLLVGFVLEFGKGDTILIPAAFEGVIQFDEDTEFYISGRILGSAYTGFYTIKEEETVESLEELIGMPTIARPALVTAEDGRKLIILQAVRTSTMTSVNTRIRFIDPEYGLITIEMDGAEFERLWNGGEIQWLE